MKIINHQARIEFPEVLRDVVSCYQVKKYLQCIQHPTNKYQTCSI